MQASEVYSNFILNFPMRANVRNEEPMTGQILEVEAFLNLGCVAPMDGGADRG